MQNVLNVFESGTFSKKKKGKGPISILDRVASGRIACVAKISDRKQWKILIPNQTLRRLPRVQ